MTPKKNIEIKARCQSLSDARAAAQAIGAKRAGVLHQIDTYFEASTGRLKLREIREGRSRRAELIAYSRPNHSRARQSAYYVVPVPDPALLKSALRSTL